jgi:hypothetical protein
MLRSLPTSVQKGRRRLVPRTAGGPESDSPRTRRDLETLTLP